MSGADRETMDALLRVEMKLDSIISALNIPVLPLREGFICPACHSPISFVPNFAAKLMVRRCQCNNQLPDVPYGYEDVREETDERDPTPQSEPE